MTKQSDYLARDAAKVAKLVKETAESTATALNIQYIQRDIADMKVAIEKLTCSQEGKVESLEKLVYTGMGIAIAFSFGIPIVLKFVFK